MKKLSLITPQFNFSHSNCLIAIFHVTITPIAIVMQHLPLSNCPLVFTPQQFPISIYPIATSPIAIVPQQLYPQQLFLQQLPFEDVSIWMIIFMAEHKNISQACGYDTGLSSWRSGFSSHHILYIFSLILLCYLFVQTHCSMIAFEYLPLVIYQFYFIQ